MSHEGLLETVWVVVVREGGVYQEVRVFATEESMNDAGYDLKDVETDDWPHMKHWILQCEIDY